MLIISTLIALISPVYYEKTQTYDHPVYTPQEVNLTLIPPVMVAIGQCESGNRQFLDDGSVVKNPHSSATGKYQIMASLHQDVAESLGMDIYTEEGNTDYALWLYEKNGTRDWLASVRCWSSL